MVATVGMELFSFPGATPWVFNPMRHIKYVEACTFSQDEDRLLTFWIQKVPSNVQSL